MKEANRYQQAKVITMIGAGINALLGFIKLIGGLLYNSHALVADGFHSFSDLLTDAMVLIASKYGSQDADPSHPYGHQRIETAATLILALVLILAGSGIAWDSFDEILQGSHATPNWFTIPIALLSILANEVLFQYSLDVGEKISSELIIANAWHHRSDAASSLVVLVGIIGSMLGFSYLDAVAAIFVGFMIIKMGWDYGWDSVKQLVDTAVDPVMLEVIGKTIKQVDGVQKIHQLRSRSMGKDVFVDVHVLVSPKISVSEGHFIAQIVHQTLLEKIKEVKDVTVHIDPEDDEEARPSLHLPNRSKLEHGLLLKWKITFPEIQNWVLHYLDGDLSIDLFCLATFNRYDELNDMIEMDLMHYKEIKNIRILRVN
jgi:cation diffusion facilitator family transporter